MKRALIIGINYSNKKFKLKSPESDALKFEEYLLTIYPDLQITKLIGDEATLIKCLDTFESLVRQTKNGDLLIFYFSGHGTQIPDDNGDEVDGYDEALLPADAVDFKYRPSLLVDDIFLKIIEKLPKDSICLAIVDACHSSSIFDLTDSMISLKSKILSFKVGKGINPVADVRVFSSSKDNQESFEDSFGGIFTRNFIEVSASIKPMYEQLNILTQRLEKLQTPTISLSRDNSQIAKNFFP